jgi:hypothetical protein
MQGIGGYKATLKNPHTSEEAKEHAQKMLDKLGTETETSVRDEKKDDAHNVSTEGKNPGNVIGSWLSPCLIHPPTHPHTHLPTPHSDALGEIFGRIEG